MIVGVATSAFQTEGGLRCDGRGPSIWDDFVAGGDEAVDHYRRWREDLDLLAWLGVDAYRFSIAWPRVMPGGRLNPAGLDFYTRLVDRLLELGIRPFPTLYHWDLPLDLCWRTRSTALAFADYCGAVVERLGDRVESWTTLNEPWCSAVLGYMTGEHAPGERSDDVRDVVHHLLLAHGLGVQAVRAAGGRRCGIAMVPIAHRAARPEARQAARRAWDEANRPWFDPLLLGRYPGEPPAECREGDLEVLAQPLDFLGLNIYYPSAVDADGTEVPLSGPRSDLDWPVDATVVGETIDAVRSRYATPPLVITETGCPAAPAQQLEFLRAAMQQAENAKVEGVFLWTLTDNLEWQHGFGPRFGLFDRQRRPRAAARWLRARRLGI